MRVFWVKIIASVHVAFMLSVLASPLMMLAYPDTAFFVFVAMTVTILSWLIWPRCVISNIEDWARKRAKLKPMDKNFISYYATLFFGIRPPKYAVGGVVYTFSAFLWLASLVLTFSQF